MPSKRKKYQIESVQITPAENATVKSVMDRLMGRKVQEVVPSESTQGSSTAQSSTSAQSKSSAQTTQSKLSAQTTKPTQSNIAAQSRATAQTKKPTQGSRATLSRQPAQTEIAPTRDFMKAANSIVREAIRHGLFRGKSKQLYDFLYSKTRGAIVPTLSVRLRRSEVMKGSSIGSTHTLRDNLIHLRAVGLISWQAIHGEQDGNVYAVHLPEEAQLPFDLEGNPVQVSSTDHSDHSEQKLLRPLRAETALSDQSTRQLKSTTSEAAKTFLKDRQTFDDDAALAGLVSQLKAAAKALTGKEPMATEEARWSELAKVLIAELQIAAARTGSISSVPAFLAEHLRRRLWKKDKAELSREGLVEAASRPSAASVADFSKCPDCGGSGMYYPEGYEKGVVKCQHKKLLTSEEQ